MTESDSNTIADVAVGEITRGDNRLLPAEHPPGKPSAGYKQPDGAGNERINGG
mgnify:CR=1 FL=1|jgi:hypothetical protein